MNSNANPQTFSIENDVVEALQSTAMLIRLTTSSFGTQVTHREKSDDVTNDANAARDAARVVVNRLPGSAKHHHARVTKMQSHAREAIANLTTNWDDSGWRLLVTTNFERLMKQLYPINEEFKQALEDYRSAAPAVLQQAQQELGSLRAAIRMPTPDELTSAYTMATEIIPIPDGANFRHLPPNVREALSNRLQKQLGAAYERGVAAVMNRAEPLLQAAVERLTAYDHRLAEQAQGKEVGRHGAFRDSLISNFQPVLDLVTALDVAGDSRLQTLRVQLEKLVQHSPQELRDDDRARATVVEEANTTLALMQQWGV